MGTLRHIFVINPVAGPRNQAERLIPAIKELYEKNTQDAELEIYVTKYVGDGIRFVRKECEKAENAFKKLRFYACGGDGTLNEVINGVMTAESEAEIEVGCLACGTGNDFVKNFNEALDFTDLKALFNGESTGIDLIYVPELNRYSINICTAGFDSDAAGRVPKYKRLPLVSGKMAYNIAVVRTLMGKLTRNYTVRIDEEEVFDDELLLNSIANGKIYGGGFCAAPRAEVNNGLLEYCGVRKLTRLQCIQLIGYYQRGEHLENEKIAPYVIYRRCRKVQLTADSAMNLNIDGEIVPADSATFEVKANCLKFILPV